MIFSVVCLTDFLDSQPSMSFFCIVRLKDLPQPSVPVFQLSVKQIYSAQFAILVCDNENQLTTLYVAAIIKCTIEPSIEKDLNRSQGKGRRVCLGDRFLAALAILPRLYWKKWLNSSYHSRTAEAKYLARQGICPPNRREDLCLGFCLNPSSTYE